MTASDHRTISKSLAGRGPSNQANQAPLCPGIGVDIGLGLLDGVMAGQLLHVAETAAGFEHEVRRVGDEGAAPECDEDPLSPSSR